MIITAGIGFFANVTETTATKLTYSKITNLEGIIGENAGDISSYSEYSPTSNITGWYGNSTVPLTDDGAVSPYVISPRGVVYTPENYTVNMRSFTYTTGDINYANENPVSNSTWQTNKAGVTYASYPIVGDASLDSRDSWIKYSDGSSIHGGVSTGKSDSSLGIGGYRLQRDSLTYHIGDVYPSTKIMIFATVSEIMAKAGVTLDNNYKVSFTGNVLYNCNLYADKNYTDVNYDNHGDLRTIWTHTDVYLQGYKSTASSIRYMNGVYTGLDENEREIWSSANVYVYSDKANITVTVGIPSIRNPTYADPYQLTTLNDSGLNYDPITNSYTLDWTGYPLTASSVVESETYTIDNTVSPYVSTMSLIPDTNGDITATLSDGTVVDSFEESFNSMYSDGIWGYRHGGFNYTPNGSSNQYTVKVNPNSAESLPLASKFQFYAFTGQLISKYVPNPIEGDTVQLTPTSGITESWLVSLRDDNTNARGGSLRFDTHWWSTIAPTPINRAGLSSFDITSIANYSQGEYLQGLSNYFFVYTDGVWIPHDVSHPSVTRNAISESLYYESESGNVKTTYYRSPGNLILFTANASSSDSNVADFSITLTYTRNTVQFATTDPDVVFSDFTQNLLSNGDPLYGGQTTNWITLTTPINGIEQVKLTYKSPDTLNNLVERSNLRWVSLTDAISKFNPSVLQNAVDIYVDGSGIEFYETLANVTTITNPTPTQAEYTVELGFGSRIACDHFEYDREHGYWNGYLNDEWAWTGDISRLYLVTTSTDDIDIDVVTKGYIWGDNPSSDSRIAFWSNGADNQTIVNGSVSFLLVPLGNTSTNIEIYTGDIVQIQAVRQGSGYMFSYNVGNATPTQIGQYAGLYVTYSVEENTITIAGLVSVTNSVAYSISPITLTSDLVNTDSLKFIYFIAMQSNWGAYITQTVVENDPLGMLWGGFNVNLNNYLSMDIPGLRVTINGVVAYGDSLTINGITLPVADGKITYEGTQYTLKGSSIEYRTDGKTYLNINEGMKTTLDLGRTQDYSFAGEGAWYFSTAAYKIIPVTTTGYEWQPGWELNWNECLVLFCVATIMLTIVCMRVSAIGELDWMDWIVIIGAIVICFCLIGGSN